MRYLACITYDGTNFYGSQVQKDKRTICGCIEEILSKILNKKTSITTCSRTDRGVHANNFYFHFDTDKIINEEKLKQSINSLISEDIYLSSLKKVKDDFHARYDVAEKEYVYIINTGIYNPIKRNYELEYNKELNIKLLKNASKYLVGTHDFKSFTSDNEKESYTRTIKYIKIKKERDLIKIYICADGFLKYMIRNIIGLFIEINEDKKTLESIPKILESRSRVSLGIKAPSNGLYLNKVKYKVI